MDWDVANDRVIVWSGCGVLRELPFHREQPLMHRCVRWVAADFEALEIQRRRDISLEKRSGIHVQEAHFLAQHKRPASALLHQNLRPLFQGLHKPLLPLRPVLLRPKQKPKPRAVQHTLHLEDALRVLELLCALRGQQRVVVWELCLDGCANFTGFLDDGGEVELDGGEDSGVAEAEEVGGLLALVAHVDEADAVGDALGLELQLHGLAIGAPVVGVAEEIDADLPLLVPEQPNRLVLRIRRIQVPHRVDGPIPGLPHPCLELHPLLRQQPIQRLPRALADLRGRLLLRGAGGRGRGMLEGGGSSAGVRGL
mmetsp:Transcript_11894/g.31435  ORF Transcript_11894/g.31435 Transcript_11894/m.31435 type:complete len:311 (-) Transcript_11894:267-1199(-)